MPRKSAAVTVAAKRVVRAKAEPTKAAKAPARPVKAAAPVRTAVKTPVRPAVKSAVKLTMKSAMKSATPPAGKDGARSGVKGAVKAAAKALSTPARRPVARKAPAPTVAVAAARPLLVRDSFTMPEQEYAVLAEVKSACLRAGIEVKKSELLRVGVALLGQVDTATLKAVLAALPQLKTGRPPADG